MGLERDAALAAGKEVLDWSHLERPPVDGTGPSTALAEMIRTSWMGQRAMEEAVSHHLGDTVTP